MHGYIRAFGDRFQNRLQMLTFETSCEHASIHKYKAIWPHRKLFYKCLYPNLNKYWSFTHRWLRFASQIGSFSLSKALCAHKHLKLHISSHLRTYQTLNLSAWIAWYAKITPHAHVRFWDKFQAASFSQIVQTSQCKTGTSGFPLYYLKWVFLF